MKKRGQLTVFVIVALVLVALVVLFFVFRGSFTSQSELPEEIEPVYRKYISCLEEDVSVGVSVLESQGGYIYPPEFEPGSSYMPFSSQLDFLGNPVPYWFYVSGNNIPREQVPSTTDMEEQLERFIEEESGNCVFEDFYDEGYEVYFSEPDADVTIRDSEVELDMNMDMGINFGEESVNVGDHSVTHETRLGELYETAREVYEYQQENLFLEEYAIDNLRLYAPVDGVEISCSPRVWNAEEVFSDVKEAVESNTLALKARGGDFTLSDEDNEYFVTDLSVENNVRFINSQNWSSSFEVSPAEGGALRADPVGNQPGLGAMGFCYSPYHFVYNMKYPVLVQVYEGDEIFQFPLAVVVQGNQPREALDVEARGVDSVDLCQYKNTPVNVRTYDNNLNPIESEISFECFGVQCEIGESTVNGFEGNFPQCVNGRIVANAEGFKETEYQYSTTESGSVEIFLDKLHEVEVDLTMDGAEYNDNAVVSFLSGNHTRTIVYPNEREVELVEGQYTIQVHAYTNSTLRFEQETAEHCFDVPVDGIGGFLGATREKCVETEVPEQQLTNALYGGGSQEYYVLESELERGEIQINGNRLPEPTSLQQLQNNYVAFEESGLEVRFNEI